MSEPAAPPPEEQKMETHKPKPWQGEVKEARAALRQEIIFNDVTAFARRIAVADYLRWTASQQLR